MGYYGFYGFDWTFILLIPAIIFAAAAQAKVSRTYGAYSKIRNSRGCTGAEAARKILDANGLDDVRIELTQGKLSDHYDPRKRVMRLSPGVYNESSVAAVSIAAHESGHAIQHGESYVPLKIRSAVAPAVSFASTVSWILLIAGLIVIGAGKATPGNLIFNIGIICFVAVVLFQTITLPVEFNASKRALQQIDMLDIVDDEEKAGAKKVLSAAAMTYVAALAVAVLNLVRLLLIRGRN